MKRVLTNRAVIATLTATAVFALAACGGQSEGAHDQHGGSGDGSSQEEFNDADVMFAQMMIPHHEQAVEMAELAESRVSDDEIGELAGEIKGAQDPEIETMTGWLEEWDQPLEPEGHGDHSDMKGMVSQEDMKAMEDASGAEFDKMFAEHMIAHHEGAIEMAQDQQADGKSPEATELAAEIESAQEAEITQMEEILQRL